MSLESFGVDIPQEKTQHTLEKNEDFINFQKIEVTKVDKTKPWEPPVEVSVTKEDGTVVESLDANTPLYTFKNSKEDKIFVTAAVAGHIDSLHIKGEDAGSKFDYNSLSELFEDISEKIPEAVYSESGVSAFSVDMNKEMGKEGVATMRELESDGIIDSENIKIAEQFRDEIRKINESGNGETKKLFIQKFSDKYPNSKIQFQIIRREAIIPIVNTPKRKTNELFMVFGPGTDNKRVVYTMAPGRYMPKHPIISQHKIEDGSVDEKTFKESSDAWFNTVMLTGE